MIFPCSFFRCFAVSTITLLGLCLALSAHATDIATAPASGKANTSEATLKKAKSGWNDLTPAQQQILAPLAPEWSGLSSFRKKKWLELAVRYNKMPAEARGRMQTRIADWAKLSPEQRRKARQSYINAKKLTAQQKAARWEHYQQLPEEKKEKLAATAPTRKSIVNPPLIHNKKTTAPKKPAAPIAPTPVSTAPDQAVPVPPEHKSESSTEPDSDSAL